MYLENGLEQGYAISGPPAVARLQVPSCSASRCHAFGCQSLAMPHGTCSFATAGGPLIAYPCYRRSIGMCYYPKTEAVSKNYVTTYNNW